MIDETQLTLATDYVGGINPSGWWLSEKYDGCRAYWDGQNLCTRGGNKIKAPAWFTAGLSAGVCLDGEVWAGRHGYDIARVAVQHGRFARQVRYMVFDAPLAIGSWGQRMKVVQWATRNALHVFPVPFRPCCGPGDLRHEFHRVIRAGGEGICLRDPDMDHYVSGRTRSLLRIKTDCHLD